jgi:transposase
MKRKTTTDPKVDDSQTAQQPQPTPRYDCIKLGIDWHARQFHVARIIDNAAPEPAQRFTPEAFLKWAKKQMALAREVHSCYEAGAGGFVLHRQLSELGVKNLVVTPRKLDPHQRGVQNDKLDARELAMDLDAYVRGNDKRLRVVFVPTPEQEQRRAESRQRQQLREKRLALAAQGRSLLLGQGWHESNQWWKPLRWLKLKTLVPEWLLALLENYRAHIQALEATVARLHRQIEKTAPALRPKGLGALSLAEVEREVGDFTRFKNRKAPGSYTGLCGGVSASDQKVYDLSITKAGNRRLRAMLVEIAWRWVFHQPQSRAVQRWRASLLSPGAHRRGRKRAIIALARQVFVDLWRWQTGRCTPEQLGWIMMGAVACPAAS